MRWAAAENSSATAFINMATVLEQCKGQRRRTLVRSDDGVVDDPILLDFSARVLIIVSSAQSQSIWPHAVSRDGYSVSGGSNEKPAALGEGSGPRMKS